MYRPRRFSENELRKAGVILVDDRKIILRCEKCGESWMPNLKPGGKLPRGYWQCPHHRCNVDKKI